MKGLKNMEKTSEEEEEDDDNDDGIVEYGKAYKYPQWCSDVLFIMLSIPFSFYFISFPHHNFSVGVLTLVLTTKVQSW